METKKVEINCETGEVIEREMTQDELSAEKKMQEDALKVNPNDLSQTSEALAKATQRQALLDRLGLTSEEAKILLGA
jgi:hypothetical protein